MRSELGDCVRANPAGDWPRVDSSAYVDPRALIVGNVVIGADVYVGPNAVVRADEVGEDGAVSPVEIGAGCNVQDGVIVHALGGTGVTIGEKTSLAHGCIIHGPCSIGRGCFVGFRAVVYGANLSDGVFVGTGAVVQGVDLGADALVPACGVVLSDSDAAKIVGETSLADRRFMRRIVATNVGLARGYSGKCED